MKTFPADFSATVATKRGASPVWILALTAGATTYYLSDQVAAIAGWNSGITTKAWIGQWGEISEQLTGGLNEIRISDFSCTLLADPDDADNITHLATAHNLEASACSLYLWFIGLDATTDPPQEFFRGYVRDVSLPDEFTVQLTLEDEASRLDAPYGVILSQEEYPTCLNNHIGRLLPVIFGTATGIRPPVAAVDATYNYYLFGCPLDSIANVKRRNNDGSVTTLTAVTSSPTGDHYLFTGVNASYGNQATLQIPKQTGSAVSSTQQETLEPTYLYISNVQYPDYNNQAIDHNDTTAYAVTSFGTYPTYYYFTGTHTALRVRGRFRVAVSNSATITITVKNSSGTGLGTVSLAGPFSATWLDTGWLAATGTVFTLHVTFNAYPNGHPFYGAHLDLEYSYTSGTTYSDNPIEITTDPTRHIGTATAYTLAPTAAPTYTSATITDEPNQRDGNLATYASYASTGINFCYATWSTVWDYANGTPLKFRFACKIKVDSGAYAHLGVCEITGTAGNVTAPASLSGTLDGTYYSSWQNVPEGATTIVYHVGFDYRSTLMRVYGVWVEFSTVLNADLPESVAAHILGATVSSPGSLPAAYQVRGAIIDSRKTIDWLDYLAFQYRYWFRISCGTARLLWRDDTLTSVATISAVRVESGRKVWASRRAPKTDIVNAITLRYSRDYSKSGTEAYSAIASATDATSISAFGKLSRDELFAFDFCDQVSHAESVRDFYLAKLKDRYWLEDLEVFLDQIALEFGDVVTLPDGRIGVVVSVGIQPGSVEQMDRIKLTVMV